MEYGLTDGGFVVKPFETILEEQKQEFKSIFGDDIDLSPQSVAGAYCYNQAIKITQLWELLGGLYSTTDISSATGIYLDRLANLLNVERIGATKTSVYVCLFGNTGLQVPIGHLVKDKNNNVLSLRNSVIINRENCFLTEIKIKTSNEGTGFTFTIDDEVITYTAEEGDSKEDVKEALKTAINTQFPNIFVFDESDEDILKFHIGKGYGEMNLFVSTVSSLEIKSIACIGLYDCEVAGNIYISSGDVNQVVNSLYGLNSVYNYIQGETGTDAETDDEFRITIKNRQKNASGNEVAIANAVRKVDDVSYVKVYSNRGMTTDEEGRPPKSFEVVVIGGEDNAIAKTIFETAPAGIQPYGTTNVTVKDSEGFDWNIGFSHPANEYIWIKVWYGMNPEEDPSVDIENEIKTNLAKWGEENLTIALDLIYQKLYTPIYQVKGLTNVTIKLAVTNTLEEPEESDYHSSDITIGASQIALIDADRITVIPEN